MVFIPTQALLKKYFGTELNGLSLITAAIAFLLDKLKQSYSANVPTKH